MTHVWLTWASCNTGNGLPAHLSLCDSDAQNLANSLWVRKFACDVMEAVQLLSWHRALLAIIVIATYGHLLIYTDGRAGLCYTGCENHVACYLLRQSIQYVAHEPVMHAARCQGPAVTCRAQPRQGPAGSACWRCRGQSRRLHQSEHLQPGTFVSVRLAADVHVGMCSVSQRPDGCTLCARCCRMPSWATTQVQ